MRRRQKFLDKCIINISSYIIIVFNDSDNKSRIDILKSEITLAGASVVINLL
jgi:hypothetical protein